MSSPASASPGTPSIAAYVDAYEHTILATIELADSMTDEEWARPTWLAGWSVGDNVAHIAALERQFLGEDVSAHQLPPLPHVTNEIQAHMERGIDVRRSWPRAQVLDDLRGALAARLAVLRDPSLTADSMLPGLMGGEGPAGRLLPIRVFDCWAHEQDVRAAVERPGNLDSPAAVVSYAQMGRAAGVMAKAAGLDAGVAVVVASTGPGATSFTVGDADAAPAATITTDGLGLFRLCAGRGPAGDVPVTITGDATLAARVMAVMAITP